MADPTDALAQAGSIVSATGLNIGQWPPEQVRGLFIDVGLVVALILALWRFPWSPVVDAISKSVESWATTKRAEADAARATAESARAEAEAFARIKMERRNDDR